MFAHVWKMRARKKRAEAYEKFAQQITFPALQKLEGCLAAYCLKVFESRRPQYLWVVFWKDQRALEAARAHPVWREQIRRFEEGRFYKSIPLQLACECLGSFGAASAGKAKRAGGRPKSAAGLKPKRPER